MKKNEIYTIFDGISENFILNFIADNEKVAKRSYKTFVERNKLDWEDLELFKVVEVEVPVLFEDKKDLVPVDVSDLFKKEVVEDEADDEISEE